MQMYFQSLAFEIAFRFDEVLIRPIIFIGKKQAFIESGALDILAVLIFGI